MILKLLKKSRHKPLYKKFKQVFENVQSRSKILYFKKQKWRDLVKRLKKIKFYRRNYRIFNHSGNSLVPAKGYRRPPKFKKRYKYFMNLAIKFKLFYGGLKKKYLRKQIRILFHKKKLYKPNNLILGNLNHSFLSFMEKRLDSVLHRSFFTQSIKMARQLILHGYVFVNNRVIRHGSYILKKNDKVNINPKLHNFIKLNIKKSKCWPTQFSSNLLVNYKTLQILCLNIHSCSNFTNLFPFRITIRHVIKYLKYH